MKRLTANPITRPLLPLLAAVLAFSWILLPVPAQAQSCPVQIVDKGIDCSGGGSSWSYCGTYPSGQCMAEPTCPGWQGAPAAKSRLDCPTCACACPRDTAYSPVIDQLDCTGTTDNNCQPRDLDCRDVYNRNFACAADSQISGGDCGACIAGYISCGSSEICEQVLPPTWCQAPDIWDECNDTCTFKYVLANPTIDQAPQLANPSLAGNLEITRTGPTSDDGYLFLPNGGRIRVDQPGGSALNVGNYDGAATGFDFNLFGGLFTDVGASFIPGDDTVFPGTDDTGGVLEANEVCLGDDVACRKTWPVGLPEGVIPGHVTLRYDATGGSWQYSEFLRNDNSGLAIGLPSGQSAAYLIDSRSSGPMLPILNLNDRDGGLWTGLRLARILGGDANKERWFLGMDDARPNLTLQYDGDSDNRFLNVTPAGFVGIDETVPADKLHIYGGSLRLEGEGSDDASIKLTGENQSTRAWQLGFDGNTGDFHMSRNLANLNDPVLTAQYANRRIGINNDDPGYPLDVWSQAGTAMMRLVQDTDSSLWTGIQLARYTTADTDPVEKWYIGMPDQLGGGDKFLIRRNGTSNDFAINTNGWVGIGDTTPEAQLTIQGPEAGIRVQNNSVGQSPYLTLVDETYNGYALLVDGNDSGKFKIQTGTPNPLVSPIERIVINQAGQVGINESNPVANLDISNNTSGTFTIARLNQGFAGTESMGWQLDRQGALKWFMGMAAGDEAFRITQGGSPNVDRLVISNSGNVGVGVNPAGQYRLDVDGGRIRAGSMRLTSDVDGVTPTGGGESILGAKNTDGDLIWVQKPVGLPTSGLVNGQTLRYDGSGSGSWVPTLNLFNNGERVGINEANPGFPLDVTTAASAPGDLAVIRVHGPNSGRVWTGLRLDRAIGSERWYLGMDDSATGDKVDDFQITRGGGNAAVLIDSATGNVGVGTDSPEAAFSVGNQLQVDAASGHMAIGGFAPHANRIIEIEKSVGSPSAPDYGISATVFSNTADASNSLTGALIDTSASAIQSRVVGVSAIGNSTSNPATPEIVGGEFVASNGAGTATDLIGLSGRAYLTGSGSASNAYGIRGEVSGSTNTSYGGYFSATGGSVQNYGVYSAAGNNYMRNWLAMGLNNNTPQHPIDINSDGGNAIIRINQPSNAMRQGVKLDQGGTEAWFIGSETADSDLEFQAGGVTRAVVQADGRMGVNKNDPSSTLDVAGLATVNGLKLVTGAADGLVMKSNATGEAYWGVVEYATDCTGGKFSHLAQVDGGGNPVISGGTEIARDGARGGYVAMNTLCGAGGASGEAYHICTSEDILRTIRCAPGVLSGVDGRRAWVSAGPPGYTTPAVNDCDGWTNNNSSASKMFGTYWEFNALTGGSGYGTDCKEPYAIACCTPL
jgi:hypothetical protein